MATHEAWCDTKTAIPLTEQAGQRAPVAGGRTVGVAGPDVAQQCLNLGLLDDPEVIEGDRVTHLRYRVRRP